MYVTRNPQDYDTVVILEQLQLSFLKVPLAVHEVDPALEFDLVANTKRAARSV